MKRTVSTLISILLICCLCTGVTVHAQETAESDIPVRGGAKYRGYCRN